MSFDGRRSLWWVAALSAAGSLASCAAISGLDALQVCQGAACDGGGSADSGSDSQAESSGGSDGGDSAVIVTLPCGPLTCTGPDVCCLGGAAGALCAPSCASGSTIACEKGSDCASGRICCGVNWRNPGDAGPAGGTACRPENECPEQSNLIVCSPDDPRACGGDRCGGQTTINGQVFHYCN